MLAVIGCILTPPELLQRFIALAPAFEAQWNSDRNYNRDDDGNSTLHGVCSEFSVFFRDHSAEFSTAAMAELFAFIESHVQPRNSTDSTNLDNALCTCFLENISSEPAGEIAKPYMGSNSRAFFDLWHFPAA